MKSFILFLSLSVLALNSSIASDGVSYATCDLKIIGNRIPVFGDERISPFKNLETPKMTLNFELMGQTEGKIILKNISHIHLGLSPEIFNVKIFEDETEVKKIQEKHTNFNLTTLLAGGIKYSATGFGGNGDQINFSLPGPAASNKVASIVLPFDNNKEYSLELTNKNPALTKQLIIKCKNTNNGIFRDSEGKRPEVMKFIKSGTSSAKSE